MGNETFFIHDPLVKEASNLFKEVTKEVDNNHDPKAIFLKRFMLALHDAAGPKELKNKIMDLPEKKQLNIKPTIRRLRQLPVQQHPVLPKQVIQQPQIHPRQPLHIETPEKKQDFLTRPKEKKLPILKSKFEKEKSAIKKIIPKQEHVIFYKFKFKPKKKIFGKLDYFPNKEAVDIIYKEILPRILIIKKNTEVKQK